MRDQAGFARCLGLEPVELARRMLAHELETTGEAAFYLPEHDLPGAYRPQVQDAPEIALYVAGYRRLWTHKETRADRELHFHGASLAAPDGDSFHGHLDIDCFYLGYLAAFPDTVLTIDSATVNRDTGRPVRVALRWSLRGTHGGFGRFGAPTGAPVYIMGLSHAHIVDGRIHAERLLTDEVVIWRQILAYQKA